jgi:putative endonuclease
MFFYVYILESLLDGKRYIGYTNDLKKRIKEHKNGQVFSTRSRLPVDLIYYEACTNPDDAKRRERYLKTTQGARFIGLRLIEYKRKKTFSSGS